MEYKTEGMNAERALQALKDGNSRYVLSGRSDGDVSGALRGYTAEHGQKPYAVIITCSDSRVIPEAVFSAGIGDLFVIRVAGNVIGDHQLGSIEYAAEHLGTRLVVVMGHTGCGAVGAAMGGHAEGFIRFLTDEIMAAIGDEKDPYRACLRNAEHSAQVIREKLGAMPENENGAVRVLSAVYDIADGRVEFPNE